MDNFDIENICRICFQKQDTLFSLFQKHNNCSPYEKLVNLAKLKIDMNDRGPSSICTQCLIELDTTVNFLEKCEKSNQILASRYANSISCSDFHKGSPKKVATYHVPDDSYKREDAEFETNSERNITLIVGYPEEKKVLSSNVTSVCPECGSRRRCRHWAPPTTHTCQYCQKVFTRKFNLTLHLQRHEGWRAWAWACAACGARQPTRAHAARHCAPPPPAPPAPPPAARPRRACPAPGCGKSFTTATNLNTHLRVHTGERPYKCEECGKCFTSKNTLNDHLRIHSGVKPYVCAVCGARFTTNRLAAHMAAHSAARPHACPAAGCARRYKCARTLRLHLRTHAARTAAPHTTAPARPHACAHCAAAYCHAQSLNKHVRKRHAQKLSLPTETDATKATECIS